jgi:hypothetical protein
VDEIAAKRAEVTATLNGIPGIKAKDKKSLASKPGDAWLQLSGIEWELGIPTTTWRIFVYLPQSEDNAIAWFEANAELLRDGIQYPDPPLLSAGYVDSINAINLGNNDSPVYGLEITLRS